MEFNQDLESEFSRIREKCYVFISSGDRTIDNVVNIMQKINLPIDIMPIFAANDLVKMLSLFEILETVIENIMRCKYKK